MLKLFINNGSGDVDYTQYLIPNSLKIVDAINVPTLIDFQLVNSNAQFAPPVVGSYFKVFSTISNQYLATGFVTNVPEIVPLGVGQAGRNTKFVLQTYSYKGTDDSWLLNVKNIPYIPAFINQGKGQILASIANILAPGFFDTTSQCASGDLVPYFQWSPDTSWSDLAKSFGDEARYRYKILNKVLYFQPFGDQPIGISFDDTLREKQFDPYQLKTGVITVPIVNDAIVLGGTEPQNSWDDYFVGDGFTGNFPLSHSVFGGSTSVLLQDDWTENQFQANAWSVVDPQNIFSLIGQLNIVGGTGNIGDSFIIGKNGLELGGQVNVQTGECLFVDRTDAILGGLYTQGPDVSNTLVAGKLLAGFRVYASGAVVPSASGASGLIIQPCIGIPGLPAIPASGGFQSNAFQGDSFQESGPAVPATSGGLTLIGPKIGTVINHHYQLQMIVTANRKTRYNRVYRTLVGQPFGGTTNAASGTITWIVTDIDLSRLFIQPLGSVITPVPVRTVVMQYTQSFSLPAFALYSPINPAVANMVLAYTLLTLPPQGTLVVQSLYGPTGGLLPVLPQNLGPKTVYSLGTGFGNQVATLATAGNNDQLSFYDDTIPAVGARVRLQTWDAGTSIGHVHDAASVASTSVITGDDGLRQSIMMNLKPQPRSSEECEIAAQAAILDRENPQWQGSYSVMDDFWTGPDYPRSGRYMNVNCTARGIYNQQFIATQTTMEVVELTNEKILHTIDFGQDLYLEKTLKNFLERDIPELLPQQTMNTPTPIQIAQVGLAYLPDLDATQAISIDSNSITFDVGVTPTTGIEVRLSDTGWGTNNVALLGVFTTQQFTIPRTAYSQTFYMRQRNGALTSRFTKVLRVNYPILPAPPKVTAIDVTLPLAPAVTFDWNGDLRNIYGIEIRDSDNATVLKQNAVGTTADMAFTYDNSIKLQRNITLYSYFFNLLWGYSAPTIINIFVPAPIVIPSVDQTGMVLVMTVKSPSGGLADLVEFQVCPTSGWSPLSASGSIVSSSITGAQVSLVHPLTVEDLLQNRFMRTRGRDKLGYGVYAQIFHVYTADGPVEFITGNELFNVPNPPTPNTDPVVPAPLQPYQQDIVNESWQIYIRQTGRFYRS